MILEELVSKLGFEVEGLAKLKAASKQFAAVKNDVVAVANPLKQVGASGAVAAVGLGRLGAESKKSSRGVLLLSTALGGLRRAGSVAVGVLRSIVGLVLRLAAPLAAVAAAVVGVGLAFAAAGIRAARARREFALTAKTLGTTAQNLETGANILRYLGLGDDAQKGAEKAVGAINDVLKAIRAGGEEADEARKKFSGFGIDQSFSIDKNGKMRDSVAVLLDIVQAYKQVTEQAATYRKQADAIEKKNPKQAAALRRKALDRDRKATTLAEDAGIDGTFKAVLDEKTAAQILDLVMRAQRERPTTSNASETAQGSVAQQAEDLGLKFGAIAQGLGERFTEVGVIIAGKLLPGLNSFADGLLTIAKRFGIISETTAERSDRESYERARIRADGIRAERTLNNLDETDTPAARRNRAQMEALQDQKSAFERRNGIPTTAPQPPSRPTSLPARDKDTSPASQSFMQWLKNYISPETNAGKMQKAAETKTENDQRTYTDIGNDKRNISVSVQQTLQQDAAAVAAAARNAVLGAISTKGANTSTGALTAP